MKTLFCILGVLILMTPNVFANAFITASVSPSTSIINQPVHLNLAISNAGSTFKVTNIAITANYNGTPGGKIPMAVSVFNFGPNAPSMSVTGPDATTNIGANLVFFAPSTGVTGTGSGKYYIGATVYGDDGSVTTVTTAARATVDPIALPDSQL